MKKASLGRDDSRECKLILSFILTILAAAVSGQGVNTLWLGGYDSADGIPWGGSNIDFNSGSPIISYQYRNMDFSKTNCNIADSMGNLLFATNGQYVMDAAGDTMINGADLNPGLYTSSAWPYLNIYQANFIIPKPGSSTNYYLFHNTIDSLSTVYSDKFYYSEIDISLNGGVGEVIQKNVILYNQPYNPGKIHGVKHGNGRDWWVYIHGIDNNDFLRFLVTPYGIDGPYTQAIGIARPIDNGIVNISPNGAQLAYYWGQTDLDIFDIDRCSGLLSNHVHVPIMDTDVQGGVAFSPSGRYLYVTSVFDAYQFDLDAVDIAMSQVVVAQWDSTYSPSPPFATIFENALLAPDGKIYVSTGNSTDKLHVINYPDSAGVSCDFDQNGITLPTYWLNSLPNHPNFFLGELTGSPCDSIPTNIVSAVTEDLLFTIHPNPSSGAFQLSYSAQSVAGTIEVYDVNSRLILQQALAPWSQVAHVNMTGMESGMYLCRATFGNSVITRRIMLE